METAIRITYSEGVFVALCSNMQCAWVILSSVTYPTVKYFSTLSHERHDFRKEVIEHETCFRFLYNFCLNDFSV